MIRDLAGRVESCVLRWFGHVERKGGERMAKRKCDSGWKGDEVEEDHAGDGWSGISFECEGVNLGAGKSDSA